MVEASVQYKAASYIVHTWHDIVVAVVTCGVRICLGSATHRALELVVEEGAFSAPALEQSYGAKPWWLVLNRISRGLAGNSV